MKFSIIIVTYKRTELLRKCLDSIFNNEVDGLESIQIIINGDDFETIGFLEKFRHKKINFYQIKKTTPARARNIAIKHTSEKLDYFFFIDDDAQLPLDYFIKAKKALLSNHEIDVLGGPDATHPMASDAEKSIGICLKSPFAMGETYFRHHSSQECVEIIPADEKKVILCNLWVKRRVFEKYNLYFDEYFFRNEENTFLESLKSKHVYYSQSLYVYHKRKESLFLLGRAVFWSGYYRVKSFQKYRDSFRLIYLVPLIFFIYVLSIPLVGLWFPLILYIILNLFFALFLTLKWFHEVSHGSVLFVHLIYLQPCIHLYYGLGTLFSVLSILGEKIGIKKDKNFQRVEKSIKA
jgi:glycosyltransferase involved in cell wall biosynthesis